MKFRDLSNLRGTDLFHWTMKNTPDIYRNTAMITIRENTRAILHKESKIGFECCALDIIGINAHNHAITEITLTVAANEFVARLYSLVNYMNFSFMNAVIFSEDEEEFYISDEDASTFMMNVKTIESMINTYETKLEAKPSLSPSMEGLYGIVKNQSLHFFKELLEDGLLNPDTGIRKSERYYKLDIYQFISKADDSRKEYMAFIDSYSYLIDAYTYVVEKDGKDLEFIEERAFNPLLYCVIDGELSSRIKSDARKKTDVIIRDLDTYYEKLFDTTLKHLSKIQDFTEEYAMMLEDDNEDEKQLSDMVQSYEPSANNAYNYSLHHYQNDEELDDEDLDEEEENYPKFNFISVATPLDENGYPIPENTEIVSDPTEEVEEVDEPEKVEKPKKRATWKKKTEESSTEEKPKKKRGRPKKVAVETPVEEEPELVDVSEEGPSIQISIGCPVDEDGNPLPEDTEIVPEPIDFDELHRQDLTDTIDKETAITSEETDTSDQSE